MFIFDWTILLLLPALFFALYAQQKVRSTFKKFSSFETHGGYTGYQSARALLKSSAKTQDVRIERADGHLTDHYDPRTRVLRLSDDVMGSRSVAAIGVAAHEAGHALQHAQKYFPMSIRSLVVPIASFGSQLAFPLFLIGLIFSVRPLLDFGIVLFSAAVIFHIITLPVELNASSRAIALLTEKGIITREEVPMAKKVLYAAALTYVASAAMAILQLVRMLMIRGRD